MYCIVSISSCTLCFDAAAVHFWSLILKGCSHSEIATVILLQPMGSSGYQCKCPYDVVAIMTRNPILQPISCDKNRSSNCTVWTARNVCIYLLKDSPVYSILCPVSGLIVVALPCWHRTTIQKQRNHIISLEPIKKGYTFKIYWWTQYNFRLKKCDWYILAGNEKRIVQDFLNPSDLKIQIVCTYFLNFGELSLPSWWCWNLAAKSITNEIWYYFFLVVRGRWASKRVKACSHWAFSHSVSDASLTIDILSIFCIANANAIAKSSVWTGPNSKRFAACAKYIRFVRNAFSTIQDTRGFL